ncbi:MAG: HPP family protein [Arenicellales bacterium]|nr:HPP family protein [Arenicellales bacterium]
MAAATPRPRERQKYWTGILQWLGIDTQPVARAERAVAILGSLIAMAIVFAISDQMPGGGHVLIVASAGASAILIFAVPHGRLSQPWPVLFGHFICAIIGVSCAQWLGTGPISAAVTVSLCMGAMSIGRCVHPPAGATALTAVLGGSVITDLGYSYVLTPVLVNMVTLVVAAILINLPFRWRRYPASLYWQRRKPLPPSVDRSDLTYALSKIDTFMDINEDDLLRIYELARGHSDKDKIMEIQAGRCFSNGGFGHHWEVRQVSPDYSTDNNARVAYQIIAGTQEGGSGEISLGEFRAWASYAVVRNKDSWRRV